MSSVRLRALVWLAATVATLPCAASTVTILRDSWGVPHIYADSAAAAFWAHGHAQAEDRLEDVLAAWLAAAGRSARALGPGALDGDRLARIAGHERIARERYPELPPDVRELIEAFVGGVEAYMAEHPERVPDWALEPEPHQVIALYRAFLWAWPWGQAMRELNAVAETPASERGSNAWVVAASRAAGGHALALIDPHLAWQSQNLFYEAHVHGGDIHFYGFSIPGTPLMALGHTDVFSLALTTGGPDCADVYEERTHPDDPLKYEYEGEWLPVSVDEQEIEVREEQGLRTEMLRIERTRHGPIVRREGTRAWTVRTAYDDEIGLATQWLEMIRARDVSSFITALGAGQAPPQNLLYADVRGRVYYARTGRVPRRAEGYAWDLPVPGWTARTEWTGLHPFADLVQILDPPGGFLQNCNNSPDVMMPASPLTADRYPRDIYNVRPERWNHRGRRAYALLEAEPRMTIDRARRIAVDTFVEQAPHWQGELSRAWAARDARWAEVRPAVELLLGWDGFMSVESRGATLFRYWMRAARREGSRVPYMEIDEARPVPAESLDALLASLDEAAGALASQAGRIDVRWGDANRAGRGSDTWPVGGAAADGLETLRSVRSSAPGEKGVSTVNGGQLCTTVVVLDPRGVRSFSATPFGQSDDPDSPHYTDQGRRLFSRGRLKPTWYGRAALEGHVVSRRTFDP